jgi:rare lipoprotein A (peptidoglycan hydrolase)
VRTRLIVAFAALLAASALVAAPGPASSRPPSGSRTLDPATLTAVSLELPVTATTSISVANSAPGTAAGLGPATALIEPGHVSVPTSRRAVVQPASPRGSTAKNFWRFDGDISWYGPGFYGSGTACGQKYTETLLGVAHRTLPCGTLVTFRNPANGRQITVPVIDRGPYVSGRQWDMSRALCLYLDHCYTGSIQWRWGGG